MAEFLRKLRIPLLFLLLGLGLFWFLSRPRDYLSEPLIKEKPLLDTLVTIKAYGKDREKTERAVDQAFAAMVKIESVANNFAARSEITRLNRRSGQGPAKVSPDLLNMIALSLDYSRKTQGAFDVSVGPLTQRWKFGEKSYLPSQEEIAGLLPLVGWEKVKLDRGKQTVELTQPGMILDLGGVSKGYAVDKAIEVLKSHGISRALVTTGSTTRVIGRKAEEKAWQIGVQHPRDAGKLLGVIPLTQKSISTSGDYQRYFEKVGKRYHHILDPKTGYPVGGIMAVTVVTSGSCSAADILSTGVFALGFPQAMRFVESEKGLEAIIVTSDGRVHLSSGLKGKVDELVEKVE